MKPTHSTKHKSSNPPAPRQRSAQSDASSRTKIARNDEGQLVRLKRVRRKKETKAPTQLANPNPSPNQVYGSDRVSTTSELGMAAPVQSKPSGVGVKKGRYRSLTPGLNSLVKKANPMPTFRSPMTSFETFL